MTAHLLSSTKVASPGPLVCILASLLTTVLYLALLYALDVHIFLHGACVRGDPNGTQPSQAEDEDVARERARLEGGGGVGRGASDGDWVVVRRLRKVWSQGPGLQRDPETGKRKCTCSRPADLRLEPQTSRRA